MMSMKTPTRKKDENVPIKDFGCFSPILLNKSPAAVSPQQNLTGTPRVARDIVADLYNNIQRWNDLHIKGANIVKKVGVLKADEPKLFSDELERYVNELYDVVQSLVVYRNCFDNLTSQINALTKLKSSGVLFISLSVAQIALVIEEIVTAYKEEFKVKEIVLENIAYSKTKSEVMFYAACWTYQSHITSEINFKLESLLIETGHRKFV